LRAAGFDVAWIAESLPGAADAEVLARALATDRLLLTEDKDFGELTSRFGHTCHGIVLAALAGLPAAARRTHRGSPPGAGRSRCRPARRHRAAPYSLPGTRFIRQAGGAAVTWARAGSLS
jgi:hypothetical protein